MLVGAYGVVVPDMGGIYLPLGIWVVEVCGFTGVRWGGLGLGGRGKLEGKGGSWEEWLCEMICLVSVRMGDFRLNTSSVIPEIYDVLKLQRCDFHSYSISPLSSPLQFRASDPLIPILSSLNVLPTPPPSP